MIELGPLCLDVKQRNCENSRSRISAQQAVYRDAHRASINPFVQFKRESDRAAIWANLLAPK